MKQESELKLTEILSEFVSSFTWTDISERGVTVVRTGIVDCIGVALAGSTQNAGKIAARIIDASSGRTSRVWGTSQSSNAILSSFVNGTAAHALDFDDVNWALIGHPSASLVPAMIALAEERSLDGRAVMEAYACGFEVMAAVGRAVMPEFSQRGGWHATGVIGAIGVAAGASHLLELDVPSVQMAIGIAASEASGLVGNFGTMTKPLHAGLAAKAGVLAAKLAEAGFTADSDMIGRKHGFLSAYARDLPLDTSSIHEIGSSLELENTGLVVKPYPCGVAGHSAIDAALKLRVRLTTQDLANVVGIEISATSYTVDKMRYMVPEDELQAKFSLPYQVSRALLTGRLRLKDFTPESITDKEVRRLSSICSVDVADDIERRWQAYGGSRPCRVVLLFRDGHRISEQVDISKGNPEDPLTLEELEAKFVENASLLLSSRDWEEVFAKGWHLDEVDRIHDLTMQLS